MRRVVAYIDGFNLYHGIRQRFGRSYHWLDLEALARQLLHGSEQLVRTRYFTARIRGTSPGRLRQVRYLDALAAHSRGLVITEGRFQQQTVTCRSCHGQWATFEEKESDVNLAVAMVEDAAADRYDVAMLLSADSDLCPAIRAVRRIRPGTGVVAIFPPRRHSDELKRVADAVYWLGRDKLRRSQLPDEVVTAGGVKLSRPAYWR
jgi:uncharacterized LabA/DUF88 family protein